MYVIHLARNASVVLHILQLHMGRSVCTSGMYCPILERMGEPRDLTTKKEQIHRGRASDKAGHLGSNRLPLQQQH